MNHAPTPWRVETHEIKSPNPGKTYTIIRVVDGEGRLVTEMTDLSRTEQNLANAKIIAQSPHLASFAALVRSDLTDAHIVDKLRMLCKEYSL